MKDEVALLGYGRFGRALGDLIAEAGLRYRALDPRAAVPAAHRAESLAALCAGAAFVVLAVPVSRTKTALAALRPYLSPAHTVLDVGSVKMGPMAALEAALGDEVPWAATHPLFGPISLLRAERPLRVVLCPSPRHEAAARRVRALYERIGCEVIEQTAEVHDRVMAYTHALTFFLAKGMLDAGAAETVPFAPPSFQAISRTIEAVRGDAGHLFRAIQRENPFAAEARRQLLGALTSIDRVLGAAEQAEERDPERGEVESEDARLAIPDLGARSPELREVREHIDAVDRELVALLGRRTELARRAARAKAALGQPVLDGTREAALLGERRTWARQAELDPDGVEELFRVVLRLSRAAQA